MKKIAIKIGVLSAVFVLTVFLTALLMNSESTDNMGELDEPVLPVVMAEIDGNLVNPMFGYRQQMQVDFCRESLTPVDTTRKIKIAVKSFDQKIQGLSYEIQTSDGSEIIENQVIKKLTKSDGYLKATLELKSEKMLMNQEYSLKIQLDLESGPVYYYTRVIQRSGLNTSRYVEFVQGFYQKCLNKDTASELADYIEPDNSASSNNFTNVTINSTLDCITWGSLSPQMVRTGVPVIREMNETTGSVTLNYQISAKNTDGGTELYEVSDFYRMRYTQERVMLLDFQRSAQQVFDPTLSVANAQGLNLGVVSKNLEYVTNPSADIVTFVQTGDLWSYSQSASKATRIFSFRRDKNSDERDDNQQHDMQVLQVDESGDMDFVVYGYMNRGPHEGYVGVAVYHYNSTQNAIEERVFVPSTLSYEFLERDLEKLIYVSENNQMFLLTGGKLYQIDIKEKSYQTIQDHIEQDCFVVSADNSHAAWVKEMDPYGSTEVTEIDFEQAKTRVLKADSGQYIRLLGYMNEDLVYGFASQKEVQIDSKGKVTFPMQTVKIENFDGTIKKEYQKDGMYITQANLSETLLEMQLSEKKGSTYVYKTTENIMNNKKAVEESVTQNTVYTERRGMVVRLDFKQTVSNPDPVVLTAKVKAMENANILDMGVETSDEEAYYVYAKGRLDGVYSSPAAAVNRADAKTGVVLNRRQQYVWERGNKKTRIKLNQKEIPDAVLKAPLSAKDLQDALGDSASVLDLTGCTLDSVLYEVSMQRPVIAAIKGGKSLVIVGYDGYNTLVYNPEDGKTSYMGMQDSTKAFEEAGNIFISYIENLK